MATTFEDDDYNEAAWTKALRPLNAAFNASTQPAAEKATLWKISNYRPFGIIERDPSESTYEYGDDKFPIIVNVRGSLVEQKERAELIVRSVNQAAGVDALENVAKHMARIFSDETIYPEGTHGYRRRQEALDALVQLEKLRKGEPNAQS